MMVPGDGPSASPAFGRDSERVTFSPGDANANDGDADPASASTNWCRLSWKPRPDASYRPRSNVTGWFVPSTTNWT